jgi:flagellar basal-body rod protein FlgB
MSIFEIASRQAEWLALRRAQVASNIANVNTPGYRAREVMPFDAFLRRSATTSASSGPEAVGSEANEEALAETLETGNSVNLDNELLKSSEIARNHALNAGIVRAFHRMLLLSSKG